MESGSQRVCQQQILFPLEDKNRIDHIPRRRRATDTHYATVHVFACHATEEGNLLNLLQSGRFRPSKQHSQDAQGFYAQGYETTGTASHDVWHTARVLDKTYHLHKIEQGSSFIVWHGEQAKSLSKEENLKVSDLSLPDMVL